MIEPSLHRVHQRSYRCVIASLVLCTSLVACAPSAEEPGTEPAGETTTGAPADQPWSLEPAAVDASDGIRVLVFTGAGQAFWAGWAWLYPAWNVYYAYVLLGIGFDRWPEWLITHGFLLPVYGSLFAYGFGAQGIWRKQRREPTPTALPAFR